jgi:hypothetical protein
VGRKNMAVQRDTQCECLRKYRFGNAQQCRKQLAAVCTSCLVRGQAVIVQHQQQQQS